METSSMAVEIRIAKVGSAYIAVTELAGISIRGRRADTRTGAVQALFYKLSTNDDDDAATAVDLAAEGGSLADVFAGELDAAADND